MTKRKTMDEWARIVTDCKSSGLTAPKWCELNHVKLSSYKYWLTRINKQDTTGQTIHWAEINVPAAGTSVDGKASSITIRYEGFEIDISSATETQLLAEVLKTLRCIC